MRTSIPTLAKVAALLLFVAAEDVASAFYDPGIQRWINRDPRPQKGEANLYAFVGNSPLLWLDAHGLEPILGAALGGEIPDHDPEDPSKTHLECAYCCKPIRGPITWKRSFCFWRRPNATPMNPAAFEDCMKGLPEALLAACNAMNAEEFDSVARRSKICYDHHW